MDILAKYLLCIVILPSNCNMKLHRNSLISARLDLWPVTIENKRYMKCFLINNITRLVACYYLVLCFMLSMTFPILWNFSYQYSSIYLFCVQQKKETHWLMRRFGTTWGWVNDDRIFIFGWTVPLKPLVYVFKTNKQIHLLKSLMQKMKAVNLSFLITKSDQNDCNESCTLSLSEKVNLECRSFDYIFNWLTALQRWIILMWARFICHLTVK